MARTTGTSTTLSDVLDAISTAAVAQGWTQTERYTEGDNSWDVLVLERSSFYYYIAQDTSSKMYGVLSTSNTPGTAWSSIPSVSEHQMQTDGLTPPFTHNIFATDQVVHISLESSANVFRHMSFGQIEKLDSGSWTGGEYIVGSQVDTAQNTLTYSQTRVLWDGSAKTGSVVDAGVIRTGGIGQQGDTYARFTSGAAGDDVVLGTTLGGFFYDIITNSPNQINNRSRHCPVILYVKTGSTSYLPLGYVPKVRHINIKFLNADTADPDNTSLICYPLTYKATDFTNGQSEYYGVAYEV